MKFQNVLSHSSPRDHEKMNAVILWCIDPRLRGVYLPFLESLELHPGGVVRLKCAGGAKVLAPSARQYERQAAIHQVSFALSKFVPERLILTTHADCGAYGGLSRFGGSHDREREAHAVELCEARSLVARYGYHEDQTEMYFVNFDGALRLEA